METYSRENFSPDIGVALDLVIEAHTENNNKRGISAKSFDMVQEFKLLTGLEHALAIRIIGMELRRRAGANSV